MCGIAGRINLLSGAPVSHAAIDGMCRLIAHRGPDAQGVLVDGPAGFGHRRLAILDLSDAGRQPMTSAGGRYWITFNGEIYNFLDIRRELETKGFGFHSTSDTEVLLASYEAWGPACLERLRGMFAFAIWDTVDRVLFLARDRAGKKPLFYRVDRDGIAFASEPKSFLADPGFEPRANQHALAQYLTYGYVPGDASAFDGVRKLPPAHYAVFTPGSTSVQRYWRLHYAPKADLAERDAVEQLLAHLREAVRLRLVSDVPVGAFLSGGVDSSLVVALMAEQSSRPVRTFSIGFDEQEFDEVKYARVVAERFSTVHEEFVVRPDALALLPELVWHYGEPFADSSAIPTYYLAQLTRRHVTVALNGDAGDESFAGYSRYMPMPKAELYGRLPQALRRALARAGRLMPARADSASLPARAARWVQVMQGDRRHRYAEAMMCLDSALRRRVCTPEFLAAAERTDPAATTIGAYECSGAADFTDASMAADIETYLPGDILVKVDIATMAHGLEGRSPFLDHRVMEFAAKLPVSLKLRGREKKYILRQAARTLLPGELLDRPKKGFSVPLARWFRGALKGMAFDVLLSSSAASRGIVSRQGVEQLLRDHAEGRYNWHVQIWTLLMMELWFREFIDAPRQAIDRPVAV
jgi:asparagine synthase (glutamine-hydrolysing)